MTHEFGICAKIKLKDREEKIIYADQLMSMSWQDLLEIIGNQWQVEPNWFAPAISYTQIPASMGYTTPTSTVTQIPAAYTHYVDPNSNPYTLTSNPIANIKALTNILTSSSYKSTTSTTINNGTPIYSMGAAIPIATDSSGYITASIINTPKNFVEIIISVNSKDLWSAFYHTSGVVKFQSKSYSFVHQDLDLNLDTYLNKPLHKIIFVPFYESKKAIDEVTYELDRLSGEI